MDSAKITDKERVRLMDALRIELRETEGMMVSISPKLELYAKLAVKKIELDKRMLDLLKSAPVVERSKLGTIRANKRWARAKI